MACQKKNEIVTPPNEEPPAEDYSFTIQAVVNSDDTLSFPFSECDYSSGIQFAQYNNKSILLDGTTYNTRLFRVVMQPHLYTQMHIGLEFRQSETEGELDLARMSEIVESDINNNESEYLNLSIDFKLDTFYHYRNQPSDFSFTQSPDFSYEITEYEFGYENECLPRSAIKLKGNFEGTFYHYNRENGEVINSIYMEVPDFQVVLLMYL